jgi:hypothetical protein
MLEGCSKGIIATWLTIFQSKSYLFLGNPQFAILAEYFHIQLLQDLTHVWQKWIFFVIIQFDLRVYNNQRLLGNTLILEEMQYDKVVLKD